MKKEYRIQTEWQRESNSKQKKIYWNLKAIGDQYWFITQCDSVLDFFFFLFSLFNTYCELNTRHEIQSIFFLLWEKKMYVTCFLIFFIFKRKIIIHLESSSCQIWYVTAKYSNDFFFFRFNIFNTLCAKKCNLCVCVCPKRSTEKVLEICILNCLKAYRINMIITTGEMQIFILLFSGFFHSTPSFISLFPLYFSMDLPFHRRICLRA